MHLPILPLIFLSRILTNLLLTFNPTVLSPYWSCYLMAQPAVHVNEERADLLGMPPFRANFSVNPPTLVRDVDWAVHLGCGTQKKTFIPNDVFADPAAIVDQPPPKPETSAATEDAVARDARVLRSQAVVRMTEEWNAELEKVLALSRTDFTMRQLLASNEDYFSLMGTRKSVALQTPIQTLTLTYSLSKTSTMCEWHYSKPLAIIQKTGFNYTIQFLC